MEVPEYVTREEVRRVCRELGISDWSRRSDDAVGADEAAVVLAALGGGELAVPLDAFRAGLAVELEHGTRYADANVTNNHPLLTGKIVLAHLHESSDYYRRILVAELEGDLLAAIQQGEGGRARTIYARLVAARQALDAAIAARLGGDPTDDGAR